MAAGDVIVRPVTAEERPRWVTRSVETFGRRLREGEAERRARDLEGEQIVGAYDGEHLVGTAAGFAMPLTVPGGARLPCTGLSLVTVAPTHRRRGILRAMMAWLFARAQERGDALAALYASEGRIYRRFGYGAAAPAVDIVLRGSAARLAPHDGSTDAPGRGELRLIDREEAAELLPVIHDRTAAGTTGSVRLPDHFWNRWREPDTSDHATHVAVLGPEGAERGYVVYTAVPEWREGPPAAADGTLTVEALVATDTDASLALWRYILSVDLMRTFVVSRRPVDEPALLALEDPLAAETRIGEPLWLRLLDVAAALEGRRYDADGTVCLELEDRALPRNAGRWRLDVTGGVGTAGRTDDPPDLALDVADLAGAYLGGACLGATALRGLVRIGRVAERVDGAAHRADDLFRTWPAPWNGSHF